MSESLGSAHGGTLVIYNDLCITLLKQHLSTILMILIITEQNRSEIVAGRETPLFANSAPLPYMTK